MGTQVKFDYSLTNGIVSEDEIKSMAKIANDAKDVLVSKSGAGNDFLGWIDLPVDYDKEEFARIQKAAEKIKSDSEVLLVIGIGGSYLGARAAIEFLRHGFYNSVSKEIRKTPEIYYCGNSLSGTYLSQLIEVIGDRDFSVNIISKSGTTTEPAVAFRIFKEMLEKKYGKEEAAKRIYATTDKAKGALKNLATEEGYETFVVPDDVGGRFSVLTAVGLLPIAVSGADIAKLMEGAASMREVCLNKDFDENDEEEYTAPVKQKSSFSNNKVTPMRQPARRSSVNMEVCVIKPTSVEDSREITETLLSGRTVILNLEGLDLEIAQRIIDFTSGATFAISGNLQKISNYIFLVTPTNVDISGDLQDLLNTSLDSSSMRTRF